MRPAGSVAMWDDIAIDPGSFLSKPLKEAGCKQYFALSIYLRFSVFCCDDPAKVELVFGQKVKECSQDSSALSAW